MSKKSIRVSEILENQNQLLESLYDKVKSFALYNEILCTIMTINAQYGEDKMSYIVEYCGVDEDGTESVAMMISGAIITFGSISVDKEGNIKSEGL